MKPEDVIFNNVYKGALEKGAPERQAKDSSIQAVQDYKRSNFNGVKNLVENAIKRAKK